MPNTTKRTNEPKFYRSDYPHELMALAKFLQESPHNITESRYNADVYSYGKSDYLVCTNDRAEKLFHEALGNIADETINQLPSHLQTYFDRQKYIDDIESEYSRDMLATANDYENSVTFKGETYYIYQL